MTSADTHDRRRDVADLKIPLLAIFGEIDIRLIWPVPQLVALMLNARLHVIPNALHDFWYTHTDQLGVVLREFIVGLAQTLRGRMNHPPTRRTSFVS